MTSQEHHKVTTGPAEAAQESSQPPASSAYKFDQDVDSVLDEIDSVLEENAEEFVNAFVQKGGQ